MEGQINTNADKSEIHADLYALVIGRVTLITQSVIDHVLGGWEYIKVTQAYSHVTDPLLLMASS